MQYKYIPQGVCSMEMIFDIENNIIVDQINSAELVELNEIKIDNTLDKGMYRFVITLYDKNGNSYTEKTVNFYVE